MLAQDGGDDQDATSRVKKVMFITDSMNAKELDSDGSIFLDAPVASTSASSESTPDKMPTGYPRRPNKRMLRVARGSGCTVAEVEEVLVQHKMLSGMVKQFGGLAGMAKAQQAQQGAGAGRGMPGMGGRGMPAGMGMPSREQMQNMQRSLPPQFQSAGGMQQLQQMARVSLTFGLYVVLAELIDGHLITVYGYETWDDAEYGADAAAHGQDGHGHGHMSLDDLEHHTMLLDVWPDASNPPGKSSTFRQAHTSHCTCPFMHRLKSDHPTRLLHLRLAC